MGELGNVISLRAKRKIKQGDEMTISYISFLRYTSECNPYHFMTSVHCNPSGLEIFCKVNYNKIGTFLVNVEGNLTLMYSTAILI